MIRLGNPGDTGRVIEMMAEAHKETPFASIVDFNAEMARARYLQHLSSSSALVLIHDVGGAARGIFVGAATDHPNVPVRLGIEVVSWIDPGHRGMAWFKMKRWFETWAKERGCVLSSLSSKSDERFAGAIERDGYWLAESHYLKVL